MNTGVLMAHCQSFTKLALTENGIIQPDPADFTIECTQDGTQNLPAHTITGADGNRSLHLWAIDANGKVSTTATSVSILLDRTAPTLQSVNINDGATYAGSTLTSVKVGATDNISEISNLKIRLKSAHAGTNECQSEYADDSWVNYTNPTTAIPFQIGSTDGIKKVCAWAKDELDNVSAIAPTLGQASINFDTIVYEVGNPPVVSSFSAIRNSGGNSTSPGDAMTLNWSATDAEGLDNSPISISYTTNNLLWKDIISDADSSNPANVNWLGSLVGNPTTGTDSVTSWTAPGSSYFRLRAVSRDVSGNTSIVAFSEPFNTGGWSVFAGSKNRGVGGGALAAAFYGAANQQSVSINPTNGDMYLVDISYGIKKVDAATAKVSIFINNGTLNLPDDGPLPATPQLPIGSNTSVVFDNLGRLYVTSGNHYNAKTYQINLTTNQVLHYAGSGVEFAAGGLATNLMATNNFTFDESNSMYMIVMCAPMATPYTQGKRLIKIAQNPDGTPGATTRIIGDCTYGAPNYGGPATASPMGTFAYPGFGGLAVWNNGANIYFDTYSGVRWKIINGTVYSSNAGNSCASGGAVYNPLDSKLYKSNSSCGVDKITINDAGNGGEIVETILAGNATSVGCTDDGILATSACTKVDRNFALFNGQVYFSDGTSVNSTSYYRVRYIGEDLKIRTLAGSLPFFGDGQDKNVIRGALSGIYYKKASEPNQAAFPAGLYFMDRDAGVFGHIDAVTDVTSVLWGNQVRTPGGYSPGDTISKGLSMGAPYGGGSLYPLTFDSNGLPWLRLATQLYKVDATNQVEAITTGNTYFQNLADGADPQTSWMHVYALENLTLKNQALFRFGASYVNIASGLNPNMSLKLLDFGNSTTKKLMGGNYVYTDNEGASPDVGAGAVLAAPIRYNCYPSSCFTYYHTATDRFYFSEGTKVRYISGPEDTATSTLNTLLTSPLATNIYNLTISPNGSQLWYVSNTNRLYCFDLSSGKSWCDNTTNHFDDAGAGGFSISSGPNQMTWIDDNRLLISTYQGEVLQFQLPAGP